MEIHACHPVEDGDRTDPAHDNAKHDVQDRAGVGLHDTFLYGGESTECPGDITECNINVLYGIM